jgi:SH3-like domain-containing protein
MHHLRVCAVTFVSLFLFASPALALCVKAKKANLRAGPSTKNQITWEVFKYMPLRQLTKQGKWIKVRDFESDEHWVYQSLVTSDFKCAVVKVKKANLRTGPGANFKKPDDLPSVDKYTVFRLERIKGSWAKVKDSFGDSYWVFRKLVWIN